MCKNIKPLFNFDPPATSDEVAGASLQFVRKISGYTKPSQVNEAAFDEAVADISAIAEALLAALSTQAPSRNREVEAEKARQRAVKRYG
jgi:hypothetical protein